MLTITNELAQSYEKLVYSIISKYSNESNREDLFQVGMIGIIKASRKFEYSSGVKFTSFAYKYILGEVLKYLREDRNVRLSRDIIKDYKKISFTKEYLYKSNGRLPTNKELSNILGISEGRINEAVNYNEKEVSINTVISEDDKVTLEDILYNKEEMDKNDLISLRNALKELGPEEKKLIYDRYYQNKTQTELAKESDISQVKIYRYEKQILNKLKDKML